SSCADERSGDHTGDYPQDWRWRRMGGADLPGDKQRYLLLWRWHGRSARSESAYRHRPLEELFRVGELLPEAYGRCDPGRRVELLGFPDSSSHQYWSGTAANFWPRQRGEYRRRIHVLTYNCCVRSQLVTRRSVLGTPLALALAQRASAQGNQPPN